MDAADRTRLIALLDPLSEAVEDLLLSGMTAATQATRDRLGVGFKEAGRARLLRLAGTLRICTEEMRRFEANDDAFSGSRLSFFLGRAWLLSTSMANALRREDDAAFAAMNQTPPTVPLARARFVVIGVFKRHIQGTVCIFEYRVQLLEPAGPLPAGATAVLPFLFPDNKNLPPEAYLVLEQKQKFRPKDLLEGHEITLENGMLATGEPKRLVLRPDSRITVGPVFEDFEPLLRWDRVAALERVLATEPDPLTLPIELQEVVVLHDWQLGDFVPSGEGFDQAPLVAEGLDFACRADTGPVGEVTRAALRKAADRAIPTALVGLLHYEACELVLLPIGLVDPGKPPNYLNLEQKKFDKAALVRALNLT